MITHKSSSLVFILPLLFLATSFIHAQNAVPFLNFSPEARGTSLGNSGASTSSDANAQYWNSSKYAWNKNKMGMAASFSPWFSDFSNSVYMGTVMFFWKPKDKQAISASLRYLNYGTVDLRNNNNESQGNFKPREYALDIGYSRMLYHNFSMGVVFRYISSDIIPASLENYSNGHGVSCDVSLFYQKPISLFNDRETLAVGMNISNIGGEIKYSGDTEHNSIPTNLRLGSTLHYELNANNDLNITLEGNKERAMGVSSSLGLEYICIHALMLRMGYNQQSQNNSNLNYFTAGTGIKYQNFTFNLAYLIPTNGNSPLSNTLSISIAFASL